MSEKEKQLEKILMNLDQQKITVIEAFLQVRTLFDSELWADSMREIGKKLAKKYRKISVPTKPVKPSKKPGTEIRMN